MRNGEKWLDMSYNTLNDETRVMNKDDVETWGDTNQVHGLSQMVRHKQTLIRILNDESLVWIFLVTIAELRNTYRADAAIVCRKSYDSNPYKKREMLTFGKTSINSSKPI